MTQTFVWTPESVETMLSARQMGRTAKQIAALLGTTKRAVDQKVERLKHRQQTYVRRGWSADMTADLRVSVVRGETAAMIAARLGVTRNSVIGKAHRLRLSFGSSAPPALPPRPPITPVRTPVRIPPPKPPAPEPVIIAEPSIAVDMLCVSLVDVTASQCRWPVGDPRADDFAFCGLPKAGGAYCVDHHALAYRPAPKRTTVRPIYRELRAS